MPLFLIYLPLIYLGLKNHRFALHAAAAVFLVGAGKKAGFSSLEYLTYVFNGVVFAYVFSQLYKRKQTLFDILFFSLLSEMVFMLICEFVPAYRTAYRSLIETTTALLSKQLGMSQSATLSQNLQWNVLLPLSEIIKNVLTTLVLAFVFHKVADRERPRFSEIVLPEWFIWVLAAGLGIAIFKLLDSASSYLLMAALVLYALAGMSIIRLFFNKMGSPSRIGEYLFYLVQPGLLFLPAVTIGVMETWWDFRTRITALQVSRDNKKKTNENNPL